MDTTQFDMMPYSGPRAEVASVTGSVLVGSPIPETVRRFEEQGWKLTYQARVPTPYGLGPLVHGFTTPSGREAIWIPFYGHVAGRGRQNEIYPRDLFWILWKAGVKVMVCGSVHGSADWRTGEERISPGDLVIPWSFWRQYPLHGDLPGTPFGGLYPNLALMGDAYCKVLGRTIAEWVQQHLVPQTIRRIHTPEDVLAFPISPVGGGMSWESDAETNGWRWWSQLVSTVAPKPVVTLFGGTGIDPVLARKLGMHLAHYHVCTDFAHGVVGTADEVVAHIDRLYLQDLPDAIVKLEAWFMKTLVVPTDCTCMQHLRERPRQYLLGMTQATPSGLPEEGYELTG